MERAGLKLPMWLNEGIAEFYATVEPDGAQWLAGRPQNGRVHVLQTQSRLRLKTLFSVDGASPYYNDPEKMQIFYAESWALTHMLAVGTAYYKHFGEFVSAMSAGRSEEEAFELAWGKNVAGVETDLDRYLRQERLSGLLYETKVQPDDSTPLVGALPQQDLDLSFADLLSSNPYAAPGIEQKLMELSRKHPDDPGFEELLGYLALREKRTELAESHFSKAVDRQSKDPVAVYNSARLQQSSGAAPDQVIPLLERALELNPDYVPARIDLGFTAAKANRFNLAAATLAGLKSVDAKMAFEVYFTVAYCDLRLNRLQDAATYAAAAQQSARSFDQQNRASAMIRIIDSRQVSAIQ